MERQRSIPALWAAAHDVPSSGGVGVLRARARSGRDGPPSCVSWVQFFASEAVGVGSSRTESVSVTHPAGIGRPGFRTVWLAADRESAAVGVGAGRRCAALTTESTTSLRFT
ncbi:hypothetical protein [Amycolatopsis japonica]|uniref:hypothetical protein n=1 Tax=Amycolatopsis japonica TaxID=208439 RepID=UPI001E4ABCF5|nr:hypothetical protein [Amycolatopsis japonica]